jgi:hypothetical protein
MRYLLVLRNASGAASHRRVSSKREARNIIRNEWRDPENMTAELIKDDPDDGGTLVYEGPAKGL